MLTMDVRRQSSWVRREVPRLTAGGYSPASPLAGTLPDSVAFFLTFALRDDVFFLTTFFVFGVFVAFGIGQGLINFSGE